MLHLFLIDLIVYNAVFIELYKLII
jgi:hypothetical protein